MATSVYRWFLFLALGLAPFAQAQDTHHTLPNAASRSFPTTLQEFLLHEQASRLADTMAGSGFVVSGCHASSSGTKVLAPFACQAYSDTGYYINQSSVGIDLGASPGPACADDDTAWVIATMDTTTAPGGNFTRVTGTRYAVDCISATQPTTPTNATILFKATISGGAVTAVHSEATRIIHRPQTISTSQVWNGKTILHPGAVLTVAPGETLFLHTCPVAGPYQIFDADEVTTGTVRISGGCHRFLARWWGTTGVAEDDVTYKLQAALNALPLLINTQPCLELEAGFHRVTAPLKPHERHGDWRPHRAEFCAQPGVSNGRGKLPAQPHPL